MTIGIIPDRKGRAVCQSWLPGGKHNVTPTDKYLGDLLTQPPFGKEGDHQVPQKKQPKKEA